MIPWIEAHRPPKGNSIIIFLRLRPSLGTWGGQAGIQLELNG